MQNPVRVKLEDGAETTVEASLAEYHGLKVLDKKAVGSDGRALPPKYPAQLVNSYDGKEWTVKALTDEVDRRNASAPEDRQIVPAGNKRDELAAALVANDQSNIEESQ